MNMSNKSVDPSAWKGSELTDPAEWTHVLSEDEATELTTATDRCLREGRAPGEISRRDFVLPALGATIERWASEIDHGRGFLLVRGLPREFSDAQIRTAFWGIGLHLGDPISQNSYGDMLGEVYDQGVKMGDGRVRGYRTNERLMFHTDRADIVGLLCLRPARMGGLSSITSSTRVYRELQAHHPDALEPLHRGYVHASMEEGGVLTSRRVPVYSIYQGVLSCRIQRNTIENTRKLGYASYDARETEALQRFDDLVNRADFRLDMMLERGDMQFINNYTTLHARTEFEDFDEPELRRHMVRLWLNSHGARRPVDPVVFEGYGGIERTLESAARPASL
jgi:TfdA family taurine catabolism dioxygenase TauD